MIGILKRLGVPGMNKTFMLRNMPYTIRSSRDFNSQLPKTVSYGYEIIKYNGPQLWKLLPKKIRK